MFFAILLGLALSSQSPQTTPIHSPATVRERSRWTSTEIPNLEIKLPTGDPASDAVVATRLRASRKVFVPLHSHPADEQLRVIKGNVALKIQDQPKTTRRLKSGESILLKSGAGHSATFLAGTEVELRGKGRLVIAWADPGAVKALKDSPVDSNSERTKMKREQEKK